MATAIVLQDALGRGLAPSTGEGEARWYAAYTCANHEKRVVEQLAARGIENWLPLYETVSQRKDRRVRLQRPIFAGYVFLRLHSWERMRALEIPSVVRLVGFGAIPTALPDGEIEAIRSRLNAQLRVEPHPYLAIGRRVRVKSGPLVGLEGILIRRKNRFRLVLSVDLIRRSVALDVDEASVVVQSSTKSHDQKACQSEVQLYPWGQR